MLCGYSVLQSGGCYGHYSSHKYHCTVRRLILLIWYTLFVEKNRKSICLLFDVKPKWRSYGYCTQRWKPNIYIIPTLYWSWIKSPSPKYQIARVTNACNLALPHFFLVLKITYRHWYIVYCVVRTTKKLLEHGSIHYTLTRRQTEYMMVAIVSNLWVPPTVLVT